MNRLGSIETLIYRSFKSFSNDGNFHREIQTLKSILKHNNCPQNFVNQCFKKFLNKLFTLFLYVETDLTNCKLKASFISKCRLTTQFRFKDSLKARIHSRIIYCYIFCNCNFTYFGKPFHHFYTKVAEHEVSPISQEKPQNL